MNNVSTYLELCNKIKYDILSSRLLPGEKLDSVRVTAKKEQINPNTVQKAFSELEKTNIIKTVKTSGRFVTTDETLLNQLKDEVINQLLEELITNFENLGFEKYQIRRIIEKYLSANFKSRPMDMPAELL